MKKQIIEMCWNGERKHFETNASDEQIQEIINILKKCKPKKGYPKPTLNDFKKGIKFLGCHIKTLNWGNWKLPSYWDLDKE